MYGVILQGLKKKNHWSLLRSSHMALQRVTGIVFSESIQPVITQREYRLFRSPQHRMLCIKLQQVNHLTPRMRVHVCCTRVYSIVFAFHLML